MSTAPGDPDSDESHLRVEDAGTVVSSSLSESTKGPAFAYSRGSEGHGMSLGRVTSSRRKSRAIGNSSKPQKLPRSWQTSPKRTKTHV